MTALTSAPTLERRASLVYFRGLGLSSACSIIFSFSSFYSIPLLTPGVHWGAFLHSLEPCRFPNTITLCATHPTDHTAPLNITSHALDITSRLKLDRPWFRDVFCVSDAKSLVTNNLLLRQCERSEPQYSQLMDGDVLTLSNFGLPPSFRDQMRRPRAR